MVSAYTSAHASGASDVKLLRSQTAFNRSVGGVELHENAVTFIGRNLKHRFPISVGVNVKKRLTDRWGIETGLVYSYLESSGDLDAEYTYRYKQKIHYLGIPLNLSYSLYQNKRLDIYLQGGGMAEMALSAHGYTRIFNHGVFASDMSMISCRPAVCCGRLGSEPVSVTILCRISDSISSRGPIIISPTATNPAPTGRTIRGVSTSVSVSGLNFNAPCNILGCGTVFV
ncbi:MAG: outer membrane beta-barrel protein [Alistipes indistinctus]